MRASTGLLTAGVLLTCLALGLVAVSFATERWLVTVVDRAEIREDALILGDNTTLEYLNTKAIYNTRYRGLFRTCFPGTEAFCKWHRHLPPGSYKKQLMSSWGLLTSRLYCNIDL